MIFSSEQKKYVCSICGKDLKGKTLEYARRRTQAFRAHSWKVSQRAQELWRRSLSAVFCEECISKSDKWDDNHKVCMNCYHFALNIVSMPKVPEVYCMATTGQPPVREIRNPLTETCKKWFARRPL